MISVPKVPYIQFWPDLLKIEKTSESDAVMEVRHTSPRKTAVPGPPLSTAQLQLQYPGLYIRRGRHTHLSKKNCRASLDSAAVTAISRTFHFMPSGLAWSGGLDGGPFGSRPLVAIAVYKACSRVQQCTRPAAVYKAYSSVQGLQQCTRPAAVCSSVQGLQP
jgi:hypothetical protein